MAIIVVPDPSLIVLVGAAGSGKSTFAARHFPSDEILSSDAFRAAIAGDAANLSVTGAAFTALHASLDRRLHAGRLTLVDATNLTASARRALVRRADRARMRAIAIVLDLPPAVVLARNAGRQGRVVPEEVVRRHLAQVRRLVDDASLGFEGFAQILICRAPDEVETLVIERNATTRLTP